MPYYTPEHYKDPTAGAVLMDESKWRVVNFEKPKETAAQKKLRKIREENHRQEIELSKRKRSANLQAFSTEMDNRRNGLEKRKIVIADLITYLKKQEIKLKLDFSEHIEKLKRVEIAYQESLVECQLTLRMAKRDAELEKRYLR